MFWKRVWNVNFCLVKYNYICRLRVFHLFAHLASETGIYQSKFEWNYSLKIIIVFLTIFNDSFDTFASSILFLKSDFHFDLEVLVFLGVFRISHS